MLTRLLKSSWMQYYNSRFTMLKRQKDRGSLIPPCLELTESQFHELYQTSLRLPPVLESLTYVVPVDLTNEMLSDWKPPYLPPFADSIQMLSKESEDFNLNDCAMEVTCSDNAFHQLLPHRLAINVNGSFYQSLYGNEMLFLHVEQQSSIGKQLAKEIVQYSQLVRAKYLVLIVNKCRSDTKGLTNNASEVFERMEKHGIGFEMRPFLRSTFDPTHSQGFAPRRRLPAHELKEWLVNTPGTNLAALKTEPADDPVCNHYGFRAGDVIEMRNPEDGTLDYSLITET